MAKLYGKGNREKEGPRNSTHIRLCQKTRGKNKSPVFSLKEGTVTSSFLYRTGTCPTTESSPFRTSRTGAGEPRVTRYLGWQRQGQQVTRGSLPVPHRARPPTQVTGSCVVPFQLPVSGPRGLNFQFAYLFFAHYLRSLALKAQFKEIKLILVPQE